ncbi:MAG TPA: pyridoxal phosphate-dependent aminotransferase [Myxococcaceae bacterium]|nr:pyridoxal phosphate-dependent aminotransferase [Myxococcaceae bacterium]
MKLARRLAEIQPSPTLALNARAKALAAAGKDVAGLSAGEPDFDTPEHVKEAAIQALREGFTKYTATAGIPELRAAIVKKLRDENGLDFAADQVIVTNGGKQALYNCFQALLSDGDEVVMFSPYWVSYPEQVLLAGGRPVVVPTRVEDGFRPDPDALARAITSRTRAVIFNSPSNPTGAVLPKANLLELAAVMAVHPDVLVVTDDIYEKLLYTGHPFANIADVAPALRSRTLVVNGMSKAYAMTGWRVGYAAGPRDVIKGMQLVQDQATSNVNSITQKAALAALTGPQEPVQAMVREFHQRRDLLFAGLTQIPGVRCVKPEGAFYAFPDVSAWVGKSWKGQRLGSAHDISERLLEDLLVAAVPGEPFGAPGHLRFSFAASRATLEKGLQRLRDFAAAVT